MRKNKAASGVSMLGLQDLHSKGKKYQGCFWTSEARPVVNSWIYMLFTSREGHIGKNCARGLEYGPWPAASGRTRDRGHSFSQYGPTKAGE